MFSIPRKLSTSLGIIGDDPKLAFRTQPSGIRRLVDARNISAKDDTYWSQYHLLFDSASDVYSLIAPNDIRRVLNEAPENLGTLIRVVAGRLFLLLEDHTFPSPPPSSFSPVANIAATWASVSGTQQRDTTKEALNCLRVLGRVLPVVFESETSFEHEVLWTSRKKEVRPVPLSEDLSEPQFVIQEEDDDSDGEDSPNTIRQAHVAPAAPPEELELPLAHRLLSTAIELLFCCGFTLPKHLQVDHHKINYTIWERGIGSTLDVPTSSQLDQNKLEVLRFIEVLLSKTIYTSPSLVLQLTNPFVSRLVHDHQTPRRLVLPILCSLLNTAMNSGSKAASMSGTPTMGNMINGVGGMVKDLPYNHLVWKDESRTAVVSASLGVLVALLDYQSAEGRDVVTGAPAASPPVVPSMNDPTLAPTATTNSFRYFLAKLHRPADLEYILNGILGILEHHMNATHHVLPGSRKGVPYVLETFLFFWKMIDLNKKFRAHLMESDRTVDTLAYLLWFCLEHKDKPQHHGLVRALSYIIQAISAEPGLGPKLSQPIPSKIAIPAKWATQGTLADFFVTSVYYMVVTTSGQLNFLYPALVIALANAAPYMQNLQVASSTRLVQLFASFSNPSFLLADEGHPRLVFFMLEILNQIVYHQFSSNSNVIYAVLRSHKRFEDLGTFTLSKGLREIQRIKIAKEDAEQIKAGKGLDKGKTVDTTSPSATQSPASSRFTTLDDSSAEKISLSSARSSSEATVQSSRLDESEQRERPTMAMVVPQTPTTGTDRSFSGLRISSPTPMSEKARGKLKEPTHSSSLDLELDPELERLAAAGVGRNGFVPTQEWVTSWQQGLPLDTMLLVISELLPKIHEIQASARQSSGAGPILEYLKLADLRSVLPPPPPVIPRKFLWTDASLIWLSSMIWGEIFVKGTSPLAIWNSTNVRLFGVKHVQPRGVSNFVGGLLAGAGGSPPTTGSQDTSSPQHARRVSRQM